MPFKQEAKKNPNPKTGHRILKPNKAFRNKKSLKSIKKKVGIRKTWKHFPPQTSYNVFTSASGVQDRVYCPWGTPGNRSKPDKSRLQYFLDSRDVLIRIAVSAWFPRLSESDVHATISSSVHGLVLWFKPRVVVVYNGTGCFPTFQHTYTHTQHIHIHSRTPTLTHS